MDIWLDRSKLGCGWLPHANFSQILNPLTRARIIMTPWPVVPSPFRLEASLFPFDRIGNVASNDGKELECMTGVSCRKQELLGRVFRVVVKEEVAVGRVLQGR